MENNELIEQLKKRLHEGEVEFTYKKKNGEERQAKGTLNKDIYGEDHAPKNSGIEYSENVIRYFDIYSNSWRSFIKENLISIKD